MRHFASKTIFVALLLLALLGARASFAQSCNEPPRNPQNVRVEIVNGEPAFTNHFCRGNAAPGDLCNELGARPRMVFKLQGPGANRWKLIRMELSPDGSNWSNPTLPQGAYDDLGFSSNPSDPDRVRGWPPVSLNGSGNQMTVRNDNCHAFDIHYRLVLRNRDGREVFLHPRLENKGLGN